MTKAPRIAILLCTLNGARFLSGQLESLANQDTGNWHLWVSDDGSTDATMDILESYGQEWGEKWGEKRITVLKGPRRGAAANFLSLVTNPLIDADYHAYCDQDDIWLVDKLSRAIAALQAQAGVSTPDMPLLYGSRTSYIDAQGRSIGKSPLFRTPPSLTNALAQNIAGGNTMVFNRATRERLLALPADLPVAMHDWWTYIIVMACGGRMIYDPEPSLLYRQHGANAFGGNTGPIAGISRLTQALRGRLREWNRLHLTALAALEARDNGGGLTPQALHTIGAYRLAHEGPWWQRPVALHRSGVFRQGLPSHLVLYLLALIGRL